MKKALVRMEEKDNGRVRLADFYGRPEQGAWIFSESRSYLKSLGALDESIPDKPRVIIPNYMNGASNCLATTGFYSVCCINECEGLLAQVESHFATPVAPPAELAAFVGALSSATVVAPRKLSS